MSLVERIGATAASFERQDRVEEFVTCVRHLMLNRDSHQNLMQLARDKNLTERQASFLTKAAVGAGSVSDPSWAAPLAPHVLAQSFLASLVGRSVFDSMLGSMIQLPLRQTVVAVSATLAAGVIAEASVKPMSRLSITSSDLDANKAAALIAVSMELMRAGGSLADNVLRRELGSAIVRATDAAFIPLLQVGVASFASSGLSGLGVAQDLRTLLQAITTGSQSRLFLITTPTIAKAWSTLPASTGALGFPTALWNGGEIAGIPILVSDQAVSGEITLVDASQVAAGAGDLVLNTSAMATVQMDSGPDSPVSASTPAVSLWQQDLVGLRAERVFGAKLLSTAGAAKITGAAYSGNSPS